MSGIRCVRTTFAHFAYFGPGPNLPTERTPDGGRQQRCSGNVIVPLSISARVPHTTWGNVAITERELRNIAQLNRGSVGVTRPPAPGETIFGSDNRDEYGKADQ